MPESFEQYAQTKTKKAASIKTPGVRQVKDNSHEFSLEKLEHPLIEEIWGGPFYFTPISSLDPALPSANLIFVEDKLNNTGSEAPWELGGGETDFMLYEGLSRVHADAILAGAETIKDIALSVWHPELVEYRTQILGKKRHPINVITTRRGELDIENQLVYNHPELKVVILTTDSGKAKLDPKIGNRTWVHVESTGEESNLVEGFRILKRDYGVNLISAIGGRNIATDLINQNLIDDLYLTHTPIIAAPENTPFYLGDRKELFKRLELVVSKVGQGPEKQVSFAHYILVPQPGIEPG